MLPRLEPFRLLLLRFTPLRVKPRRQKPLSVLALFSILGGALLLRVLTGVGFANYDTLYALVWGQQLAGGHTPRYDIPVAPTPHPLVEALGVVLSPLGARGMEDVTVALGFVALAGCGWVVYRLGTEWFGRLAGALAAVLLLTRVPVLSYGVRAYIDLPYLLLVLCALLLATHRPGAPRAQSRRPRGGSPGTVLALLALAGLLRPEAWAFSGLYWLYLAVTHTRLRAHVSTGSPAPATDPSATPATDPSAAPATDTSATPPTDPSVVTPTDPSAAPATAPLTTPKLAGLALLACAAPLLWTLSDLLVSGDALWSLTNTRHTAHALGRVTGIGNVPEYIPRRLGEILRPPVLVAAALGGVLSLLWLPPRHRRLARTGAVAGVVAVAVFAAFAAVGLPINTRYAFLGAAILCLFAGAGVFGWMRLPPGDRRRRPWMLGGAMLALALVAYAPAQYRSAHHELANLARQQSIQDDLLALVDRHAISLRCGPIGLPNHRPIPLLALRLDASPADVLSAQARLVFRGVYVDPATPEVERDFILDRRDPHPLSPTVPPGFAPIGGNRSWLIFQRCRGHPA